MQLCCVSITNFIELKKVLLQNMYKVLRERARMEWERDALIPPSFVRIVDRDIVDTKERRKQLYGDGNINFLGSNKDSHPFTTEQLPKNTKDK